MRNKGLVLAGLLLFALAFPVQNSFSQAIYGGIVGNVTDTSGAVVPNAKITVTSVGQGVSFNSTSNASGNYEQTHLIPGVYQVKVEAAGFQTFIQKGVQVNVDSTVQVNAVLSVGQVTQEVTVTGAVPLLKTTKTDVSTNFSTRQVVDLPIFNRNFTQFELLTPGTQRLGWQHAASENPQGSIQIMVNGQHFSGTSYQLDGTDNQDPILGIIVINPNLDAVTEAKITTQDYDAEFGEATAGVVTAQTKSGTNQLHGSIFEYRRNDVTSARDPFSQSQPISASQPNKFVPDILWNTFGGSLGGPIQKDKTFIFGDYQGARRKAGGSALVRVPTPAERAGNFSDFGIPIFDPYTRDASGNPTGVIPCVSATNCPRPDITTSVPVTAQSAAILSYIPMPNLTPSNAAAPNYSASGNQTFNNDGFDIRVDRYQSEKMHILGRYSFQRYARQGPGAFGSEAGGAAFNVDPSLGGFAGQSSVRNQSIAAGFDYTVSPTWLTDFRFGFFRYRVFVNPNGLGTTPATDAGIPGLNTSDITSGMPAFFINGTGGFNLGYSLGTNQCNCPLNEQEQQFQFVNNWTNIRGNHTIKFGADIRYAMNLRVPSDSHRAGELSFNDSFTEGVTNSSDICGSTVPCVGGGVGLASFMVGGVSSFNRYVSNVTDAAERQKRWFFYGQDTWRVTPKLTLNYGLRWEIYFPQTVNAKGNGAWVQRDTGEVWVYGNQGIASNGNVKNTFGNFAPRLGIAYQINPKTVLRLGYGRSFDIGTFGSIFGHTVTQNIPVLANQSLNPSASWNQVFSLAQGPPALNPDTVLQNNCFASNGVDPNPITNPGGTDISGPGTCTNTILGATGQPLLPDGISPHIHPPVQRLPTVDAWNVTVQHEFRPNLSAQIAYVANKGTHGFNGDGPNYDTNTPTIVGYSTASLLGCPAPCTNARRPYYLKYGWTQGINYYGNDASNTYESLQMSLDKRFSNGYSVTGSYTFAHAYQYDGSGYYIYDPSLVHGPSDFQRNHVVVVTQMWQLPIGTGKHFLTNAGRGVDLIVGGWQLNSVTTWETGVPFTPSYNGCGGVEDVGICRPNLTGNAIPSNQNQDEWYIPASASNSPWSFPGTGQLGNVGDNSFWGPHFWQTDISLFKNFKITEKWSGQFRAETFNGFNHVNLGQPDGTVNDSNAGRITGLAAGASQRQWDFALRFDF
jgi:Carboxypeptidase regulatory-like domain/TonB dependent receptor-like, beta-barrel